MTKCKALTFKNRQCQNPITVSEIYSSGTVVWLKKRMDLKSLCKYHLADILNGLDSGYLLFTIKSIRK